MTSSAKAPEAELQELPIQTMQGTALAITQSQEYKCDWLGKYSLVRQG